MADDYGVSDSGSPIGDFIRNVRAARDRTKARKVDEQLKNYLNDPEGTIAGIMQIDPRSGIPLNQQRVGEVAASEAAQRSRAGADLGAFRESLRGLPSGTDYGAKIDELAPALAAQGVSPEHLSTFKAAVAANPNILMDEKAYEAWAKDQVSNTVAPIGSHVIRGGRVIDKVPFAAKTATTPAGATTSIFNPNANDGAGAFVTQAPGVPPGTGGPLTVERLRPIFKAQESHGDYTARNAETGALGAYQIMPDTGRALAQKAGLPWRPDMMRKDDQASRNYQDKMGGAAMQESIDFGGGDPARTFSHYYGGSNQKQWGPKTRRYTGEMLGRLNNDGGAAIVPPPGGATITPTSVSVPPKPVAAGKTYRAATAQEIQAAGYPRGSAAQIGSDGKMVNLKTPPAANQPKPYDLEKARNTADKLGIFLTQSEDLLKDAGLDSAVGFVQGRLPGLVVGQGGQTWRNKLDSLKSNIGLAQLMEMKAASTQGASGFGNLSNAEGERLEKAYGTLETTNDERTIRDNLKTIVDTTRRANERIRWQMQRAEAGLPHDVPPVGTERDGFRFMGGSPENRANWIGVRK